ncbi:MAG: phosphotransferase [Fibrobacter sp.]|nr:phosphotransferase [Fibrobacter sp.]
MNGEELKISEKIKAYLSAHGYADDFSVESIAGAGSGRRYYRISSGERSSVLQVSAEVNDDFKKFVEYSQVFKAEGLPVPKLFSVDEDSAQILQEDLGNRRLLDDVSPDKPQSGSVRILYPEVIEALIHWQNASQSLFSSHTDLWLRRFDFAALKWETDYFTDNYLKAHCGIDDIPDYVRNFYSLLAVSVDAQTKVLMHRDFQSQNIMIRPNSEIVFVDYQGARRGSMFYDIASLLWDPYVCLPLDMVKDFFEYWRFQYKGAKIYTKEDAWESFVHASLQRVMQALGAYCFLSKTKGIQKFEQYIEPGKKQLRVLFSEFRQIAKATDSQVFSFMERALL